MTRTNYPKPSNLLQQQKQTGKSYWDMIGYPLPEVTVTANYPHEQRVWNTVNQARHGFNEPEFLRRLDYNDRRYIKTPYVGESTHLMTNDGNYAYPMIQDINGTLHNYDEKYGDYWNRDPKENGDYIKFQTPGDARYFSEHYKKYWPIYFQGAFKDGKDMIYNHLPGYVVGKGVEQTEPSYKKINIQFPLGYSPFDSENIDDSLYDPTKNVLDEVVIKPDKYTKQLINQMHTDFPDKNVRDYIYKVADHYTNTSQSTYNDVLARTLAMYDLGGKPSISITPKYKRYRTKHGLIANKSTQNPIAKALGIRYVSNYNPLSNHINIIGDSPSSFEKEISHGIQRNYLGPFMALKTKKDTLQGFINASIKGGFPYYTPGYTEYNAHHLIQPNVFKYIITGNKNYIKYIRSGVYGKEAK